MLECCKMLVRKVRRDVRSRRDKREMTVRAGNIRASFLTGNILSLICPQQLNSLVLYGVFYQLNLKFIRKTEKIPM